MTVRRRVLANIAQLGAVGDDDESIARLLASSFSGWPAIAISVHQPRGPGPDVIAGHVEDQRVRPVRTPSPAIA